MLYVFVIYSQMCLCVCVCSSTLKTDLKWRLCVVLYFHIVKMPKIKSMECCRNSL